MVFSELGRLDLLFRIDLCRRWPSNQELGGYQSYSNETVHALQQKQQFPKTAQLPL